MTVSSATNRWAYNGNGATLAFTYENRIFAAADLKVYVDAVLKTLTTDYAVSGVGAGGGGNVTFVTAPAAGTDNVVIVRDVPLTQTVDLPTSGNLPSETLDDAFDKLTILVQQQNDLILRALRQPEADIAAIGRLPAKADRASMYLAWDANGDPIASPGATAVATPVSAFIATLLDDASAAVARATLVAMAVGSQLLTAEQVLQLADNGSAVGPALVLDRLSASPAISDDLGQLLWRARSSTGVARDVADIIATFLDPVNATEDIELTIRTIVAGTKAARLKLAQGLYMQGAAGGDPGGGKINAAGYNLDGAALAITKVYASPAQTITAAGALTLAHGLGVEPKLVTATLICGTNDAGYTAGQHVEVALTQSTADNRGVSIVKDATNLTIRFGSSANTFQVLNATTGAGTSIVNADWTIIFRAFA